jgi:hypothetical protein
MSSFLAKKGNVLVNIIALCVIERFVGQLPDNNAR